MSDDRSLPVPGLSEPPPALRPPAPMPDLGSLEIPAVPKRSLFTPTPEPVGLEELTLNTAPAQAATPAPASGDLAQRLEQLEAQLKLQSQQLQDLRRREPARITMGDRHNNIDVHGERPEGLTFTLDDLLRVVINYNASDLHLKAGAPPTVRLNGDLVPIGNRVLTDQESLYLVMSAVPREKRGYIQVCREIDHAYVSKGVRFRLNAFLERGRVSAAFRMISTHIPTFEALGLPPVLQRLSSLHNGLVLVTGPAGSGKSTTLASVIDWINRNRRAHVVTIEDPIEYYHYDVHSFITQREIGTDTTSFVEALRQALRQDPNVIMVGEMRDMETIMTATTAAETGHLVLSTLHTPNTVQSIDRILDTFAGEQQKQMRMLLASCLRGVVSQKLLQRADGKGRVPAVEVLVCTSTVQSLILEGNTKEIYPHIQNGGTDGMQTFTVALTRLLEQGLVTREEAAFHADQSTEFRLATRPSEMRNSATPSAGGNYLNWL